MKEGDRMESSEEKTETGEVVEVNGADRWQVYQRLQELAIECWCEPHQPLRVQLPHAIAAVQFWSVSRQVSASRQELAQWLERCWQIR